MENDLEKSRVTLDPDLKDLIPAYLERRHEDLRVLTRAIQSEDLQTFSVIGHRLRGNAATFGFFFLESLGKQLEIAGRDGDLAAARNTVKRMERYLANLQIRYA